MRKYITLTTEDGNYTISAFIEKEGTYIYPSFNIKEHTENGEIWDNEKYLINILYPKLKKYKELKENLEIELKEIIEESSILEILDLFEEAFKIGVLKKEESKEN